MSIVFVFILIAIMVGRQGDAREGSDLGPGRGGLVLKSVEGCKPKQHGGTF
jgi:hypothetical protein